MFYRLFCHIVIVLFFLNSIEASKLFNRLPKRDICFQQGTQCSEDCTKVFFCAGTGSSPIIAGDCAANNQNCFSNSSTVATCSSTDSDCTAPSGNKFYCQQDGDFPDPFNCRKGYTCGNGASTPVEECICPPGTLWSTPRACTNDEEAVQNCCRDFELDCKTSFGGNFGPNCTLTLSGYYYICDYSSGSLNVDVMRCRSGTYFNPDTLTCEHLFVDMEIPEEETIPSWQDGIENDANVQPFCTQSKIGKNVGTVS